MPAEINSGDTAWMLSAAALVMFMTPGLGFFYAGFTRSKNALATIMQSFIVVGLVGVLWVVVGYKRAFGPTEGGIIGNLHFFVFMAAWSLLVYAPVAHWIFGAGWLGITDSGGINALDFAGGAAIHINAGAAALAAALLYGRRKGFGREPMEPHNVTYIVLGAAILWFGWFGFNAGSAGAASGQAANAFVVTNTAAAAAALSWMFASWALTGKASVIGAAAGAVAGLVAITPASGFVQPWAAIVIGSVAGVVCYLAVRLRERSGIDDSLDVVAVHGVGGTWGALATALFATAAVSGLVDNEGLFYGQGEQVLDQLAAIATVWVYSFTVTAIILKALDLTLGLRVSEDQEELGLDVTQHGERGYVLDEGAGLPVVQYTGPPPAPAPAQKPQPEGAGSGAS